MHFIANNAQAGRLQCAIFVPVKLLYSILYYAMALPEFIKVLGQKTEKLASHHSIAINQAE